MWVKCALTATRSSAKNCRARAPLCADEADADDLADAKGYAPAGPGGGASSASDEPEEETPAHARGHAGEQGVAFQLYRLQDGWAVVRGPSGAGGHGVTRPGEDGLFYNIRTGELHIVDNKSLARQGNVSSATAIDPQRNLSRNLRDMIRHVEGQSLKALPMRQEVLSRLRKTEAAIDSGKPLPARVSLIVSNYGGRSTGVTERLARQGVRFLDVNNPVVVRPGTATPPISGGTPPPPPMPPPTQTPPTTPTPTKDTPAAGGGSGPQAPVPPQPPTRTTTKTSTRVAAGAPLAVLGANVALNWLIGSGNEERIREEVAKKEPLLKQEQMAHQTLGFLLIFRYKKTSAGVTPRFHSLRSKRGHTEHEAMQTWLRSAEYELESNEFSFEYSWIPPLEQPSPLVLTTPFPKVALAEFADQGRVQFQEVGFRQVGGFYEKNKTKKYDFSRLHRYQFIVMQMPKEISYMTPGGRIDTKDVTLAEHAVAGGRVPIIMLDDDTPAVALWPADDETVKLFKAVPRISDKAGALRHHTNLHLVRWVRPEQVRVVSTY
ncbi:MAG: hypothetical protein M3227_06635 [Thermoproteota archaeon]|nr:hypothetical protein [Thermoproteota archaeon]